MKITNQEDFWAGIMFAGTPDDVFAQIEAALGRASGNALLQELLLNSYQDEMRVLTAVRETWVPQPKIGARA